MYNNTIYEVPSNLEEVTTFFVDSTEVVVFKDKEKGTIVPYKLRLMGELLVYSQLSDETEGLKEDYPYGMHIIVKEPNIGDKAIIEKDRDIFGGLVGEVVEVEGDGNWAVIEFQIGTPKTKVRQGFFITGFRVFAKNESANSQNGSENS